jgi:hypothetical protein
VGLPQDVFPPFVEPTPTRRANVNPCPYTYGMWRPRLEDRFSAETDHWPLEPYANEFLRLNPELREGALRLSITSYRDSFFLYRPLEQQDVYDFQVMASLEQVKGEPDGEYGLVFRMQGDQYYYFAISSSGNASVYRTGREDGEMIRLFHSSSLSIRERGSNQLQVVARGSQMTFCINGERLAKLEDKTSNHGDVGIAASLSERGEKLVLDVDDFYLYAP